MLTLSLLLVACGVPDTVQQVPLETSVESTVQPPAALSAPPAAAMSATVEVLEAQAVPDGLGGTVDAAAPVALSLGGGWGGRALDPVLVVGERRFTQYDYPAPGVLRFTLPEQALIEAGPTRVQWSESDFVDVSVVVQEALR